MTTPARTDKPIFPYLPDGREILFVPIENKWMNLAKEMADKESGCSWWPTGAVLIKDNQIIGKGANKGKWQALCPRVENNCPTGTGYEYCKDICEQTSHAEISAVNKAIDKQQNPNGADLYLFGHWWCCEPCWNYMIKNGVKNVYLLKNSHLLFTRENRLKLMDKISKKLKLKTKVTQEDTIWKL